MKTIIDFNIPFSGFSQIFQKNGDVKKKINRRTRISSELSNVLKNEESFLGLPSMYRGLDCV